MNQKQMGECCTAPIQTTVEPGILKQEPQKFDHPQPQLMTVEAHCSINNETTQQKDSTEEANRNTAEILNEIIDKASSSQQKQPEKEEATIYQNEEVQHKAIPNKYFLLEEDPKLLDSLKQQNQPMQNIEFYLNTRQVTYKNLLLSAIHKKHKDYDWMEDTHDYIQWLFPNHYKSRFNYKSQQLTIGQARYFRQSKTIGQKILTSFKMFLNFMGIQVDLNKASFKIVSMDRLKDALVRNTHNHLRLRRILASLSVTGFRILALWLINMLDYVIEKYGNYLKKSWSPLRKVFDEEWRIYSDEDYMRALQNCMPQNQQVFHMVNPAFEWAFAKQLEFTKKEHLREVIDDAT